MTEIFFLFSNKFHSCPSIFTSVSFVLMVTIVRRIISSVMYKYDALEQQRSDAREYKVTW